MRETQCNCTYPEEKLWIKTISLLNEKTIETIVIETIVIVTSM